MLKSFDFAQIKTLTFNVIIDPKLMFLKFQGSLIRYDFCSIFKVPLISSRYDVTLRCSATHLLNRFAPERVCVLSAPIGSNALASLSFRAVQILYHIQTHLSIPFLKFFKNFFSTSFEVVVRLFRWNSFIISLIYSFVNTFLQLFSDLAVAPIKCRKS